MNQTKSRLLGLKDSVEALEKINKQSMKNSKTAGNRHVGNVGHHEKTNYRIHVGGEPRKGHGPSLQWMIDWNASPLP